MISDWPKVWGDFDNTIITNVMNIIKVIRNTRAEKKVPDNKKIDIEITLKSNVEEYEKCLPYIAKLATINNVKLVEDSSEFSNNSVLLTFSDVTVNIPLSSMIDASAEKERIEKEISRLKSEIDRSEKMLSNEGFVAKAPAKLIEAEKIKLAKNRELLADIEK